VSGLKTERRDKEENTHEKDSEESRGGVIRKRLAREGNLSGGLAKTITAEILRTTLQKVSTRGKDP